MEDSAGLRFSELPLAESARYQLKTRRFLVKSKLIPECPILPPGSFAGKKGIFIFIRPNGLWI